MKSAFVLFLFPLFAIGVFGDTDKVESVSVKEGDSVTLHTDVTEIQKDDEIEWRFNTTRIARVIRNNPMYDNDVKFTDRLQLDVQTGDLLITNFRITDSGLYKYEVNSQRGSESKIFSVSVVPADGVKSVSVLEGDSVTLYTSLTEIQRDDVIRWRFEQQNPPVAEINRKAGIFNTSDGPDEKFRDRLELNYHTGSLTVRNINTTHSGLYEADIIIIISSRYTIHRTQSFSVTVREVMVSVMAGDSVTLHTGFPVIQNKHAVLWFDGQDNLITSSTDIDPTRDLTIRIIRRNQSGDYKVKIISSSTMVLYRIFHINISGVFSSEKDGVKTVSVVNGHSFTLHSNVTDIQNDVLIEWMFGSQNLCIASTDGKSKKTSYNNNDVRFINKVYLDNQTGDLSIKNSSTEHSSGLYQLKIINSKYTIQKSFSVTVSGSGLSPGAVAGIVVGVLLVAAAAVGGGGVIYCRKQRQKRKTIIVEEEPPQNPTLLNGNENGTELANTS